MDRITPIGVFNEHEPSNHLRVVGITKSCVQFRSQVTFDEFSPTISHTHKMDPDYSYLSLITTAPRTPGFAEIASPFQSARSQLTGRQKLA